MNETLPVEGTIDERFREMFPYKSFNRMQSKAVPVILGSDENVVVSAPTASGKTVLAEAAMVRELGKNEKRQGPLHRSAPGPYEREGIGVEARAVQAWFQGLRGHGRKGALPVRGQVADVIITTPEKWDSATRKYVQERYAFVRDVALVIVDEVHLLDSDSRGGSPGGRYKPHAAYQRPIP